MRPKLGCGFMIALGLLMCVLFFANLTFTKAFINANYPDLDFRYTLAIYSVLPIGILFLEFWLFDTITGRYRNS